MNSFEYISGFGSHLTSEALPNALPKDQNSPKGTIKMIVHAVSE
jgi:homogentisate 1,2-dioxygenase